MGNVASILAPDRTQMLDHLGLLFGRALTGRIEITAIKVLAEGEHVAPRTRFFDVEQLEEAADWAADVNAEHMWNVYVGAATRNPDVFPGKAARDEDFYKAWAIHADIDDGHDMNAVRESYRSLGIAPPFIVVTGRSPSTRAQLWWPLEDPISDADTYRQTLRGVAAALHTDPSVTAAKQLMRLGGGVNWPKKPGRVLEKTEIVRPSQAAPSFPIEQIHRAFPPVAVSEGGGHIADVQVQQGGALGLEEKIVDGRENYAFRLVRAHLHEFIGTTGCEPTPDELYRSVAPVYLKKVDLVRPGRGPEFLKQKCHEALRAFQSGQIPFMRDLDEAVQSWVDRAQGGGGEPGPFDPETGNPAAEQVQQDSARASLITATPYQWVEPAKIPPRDILYGKHLFRKFLSATVSPGGLGKSSLVIVEALSMVTGRNLVGEAPKGRLSVWYWNGEDPMEELQRRVAAACIHYQIQPDDLAGRLYVDSGRNTEIVVVRDDGKGFQIVEPVVSALVEQVKARGIDVLTIDPFVACHAVSENDNTKIEAVVKQWMRVAEEGGCAVELVHHVRKPSNGSQETTVDDARGAGALLAKVRSARVLNGMTAAETLELGIDPKERWRFFRVDNGKANLMPRGGDAHWRKMVGVPLGNRIDTLEDNVGVVTAWEKPDAFDGVKEHHMLAVRAAVEAGEWREDVRAQNWVGVAVAGVLGLDLDEQQVRAKVKSIVKTWLKNGVLEVVNGFDSARRERRFVVVGKEIE